MRDALRGSTARPRPRELELAPLGLAARRAPDSAQERREVAALQSGIELVDAFEEAETVVGEALVRIRDGVTLAARLAPGDATLDAIVPACTATLRRLRTDVLDLYLLHGRGTGDLEESVAALGWLREAGLIRHWGVVDFSLPALAELLALGGRPAAVEVRYDLAVRGPEWDLLDRCREEDLPVLAYTPLAPRAHPRLLEIAERHRVTPAQLELAWLLSHEGMTALAPASSREDVVGYVAALHVELDGHDHAMLDDAFPPPLGPQPFARIDGPNVPG